MEVDEVQTKVTDKQLTEKETLNIPYGKRTVKMECKRKKINGLNHYQVDLLINHGIGNDITFCKGVGEDVDQVILMLQEFKKWMSEKELC